MPGGGGEAVIRAVLKDHPGVRFLALSVSDAPEDVIAIIRAGARGYVTKTIGGPELVDAVKRVAAGDAVFSPLLAGFVLDAFSTTPMGMKVDSHLDQITPREREVLRLIARGYAYKEIARQLTLSVKTVETHVSSVLRKLQLSNRHELTPLGHRSPHCVNGAVPRFARCKACRVRSREVPSRGDHPRTGEFNAGEGLSCGRWPLADWRPRGRGRLGAAVGRNRRG